jgi:hypothetical protein
MYETKLMVIFYKGCDTNDTGFYGKTIFNWYDIFYSPIIIISDPFLLSMFDLNGKMILV